MNIFDRLRNVVVERRRIVIAAFVVLTLIVGSGAGMISQSSSLDQFQSDTAEVSAQEYIAENFSTGENVTRVQIVIRGDDVLSKRSLVRSLALQQQLLANDTVKGTLAEREPVTGVSNIVAIAAVRQHRAQDESNQTAAERPPTLAEQREQLRSMNESEVDAVVSRVLDGESGGGALALMPTSYEPGSTNADARMMVVRQTTDGPANPQSGESTERLVESQRAIQDIVNGESEEHIVFGFGIISDEIDRSMTDSLAIVGPFALLFVLLTLLIAYRDVLDIALGTVGIFVVLLWTFGFMGWADIAFNQLFVAVPVLLIGLSIDYAIHIFMRYREHHDGETTAPAAMRTGLLGVGAALVWVTATTVFGFLSNLVSPVPPIKEFGIVSSFGIVAALLVFGAFVPAVKVELDERLERRGFDRRKPAFGTGGGSLSSLLSVGAVVARRAPFALVFVALLVSAGGAYGATQVDTSFEQEDFIADDPPEWMESLPGPMEPSEYSAKQHMSYVNEHFLRQDRTAEVLVRGDVTEDDALQDIAAAQRTAAAGETTVVLSNGDPAIESPLTVMQRVAARNESFARTFERADTDGDGVPDRNLQRVYDALYATAPGEAVGVVQRTDDGEYAALRMTVSVRGDAGSSAITAETRDVAAELTGEDRTAVATGSPVVNEVVQNQLLDTVIDSLLITLITVFAFLTLVYRFVHGSATLGVVTLLPVALSVSWILGTMYLLKIPFNVLTGMITSLTVGLGVAYSIHLSERFVLELSRRESVASSLRTSVTGTGGALLGSAATTVGGFGVLAFAIMPPLRQFGIITGMTIVYAFLASVLVLPSLLVLWTRYVVPEPAVETFSATRVGDGSIEGQGDR